ncbi:RHS repeat domain-containing protein [Pantoea agglomerans]|uniref:RHS repeat domain-containing protein n=1 Tax=Enterobacter agglomerans TaxID=549 RepID=UPI0024134D65|nr:RHS repeat-associated core domain-containing protein [Pantoea agglomerans]
MSSPSFYSAAGNFIDSISGGVDPRTGLFNVSLPLVNLHANNLAGPALELSLNYTPFYSFDEGFGKGVALNLTRYDVPSRRLKLSTGEEYQMSSSGDAVRQKKFRNFILKKINDKKYQIIYKSGLIEELTRYNFEFITTSVFSPNGHKLSFSFDGEQQLIPARLVKVTSNGTTLLSISYPETGDTTTLTVLPDNTVSGYQIVFRYTENRYLTSVTSSFSDIPWGWTFIYDYVGLSYLFPVITGIITPTGLSEKVLYHHTRRVMLPDVVTPSFPCVYQHTITPGGGGRTVVTQWEWTEINNHGPMPHILTPDYRYSSTAKILDADSKTVLSTVTRFYNCYHLQVSEITLRAGKKYSVSTEYHARPGVHFDEQPAHYLLPSSQTETWDDGNGMPLRTRITRWGYDEAGNLLRQEAPNGTTTAYVYYSAQGEGNACPADPHGFPRYLKSVTVTPRRVKGDEPATFSVHSWKKMSTLSGEGWVVMGDTITESIGCARTVVTRNYHDNLNDALTYGREKTRTTIFTPDVQVKMSYTRSQSFTYEITAQGLRQSETLTTHDGLTATRLSLRHASLGYLLSETDALGVTVMYTYNKMGCPLRRIVAPDSAYESTTAWSYAIEKTGPVTTETDAVGNQTKTFFDGAGRRIGLERFDNDYWQKWFQVGTQTYNSFGELAFFSGKDWTLDPAEPSTLSWRVSHDGWGKVSSQIFSDGTTDTQISDPIALTLTRYMEGINDDAPLKTGKFITTYDAQSRLPLTDTRLEISGQRCTRYYEWDGLGYLRLETDELNHMVAWTYDAFGRVLTQTLPDGTVITRTYVPHSTGSQVASINITGPDAQGQIKSWLVGTQKFDGLGRLIKQVSGGRTTTYTYVGASPVPSSVKLPSGTILKYRYIPEMGNVVNDLVTDGVTQAFSYDARSGKLLTAVDGGTKIENILNSSGYLKTETFTQGEDSYSSEYIRTLAGAVDSYTDITGKKTVYGRDRFGRITFIEEDTLTVGLTYDALGRPSMQVVKDSATKATLTTTLSYDDFGQETIRSVTDSVGVTLIVSQTWLLNGLLAGRTTQQSGTEIRREQYRYDVRNRLTEYRVSGSSLPQDAYGYQMTAQAYRYDALNNLTTVKTSLTDGSIDVATYDYVNTADPTQLTSVTHTHADYPQSTVLTYDTNGCITRDEAGRTRGYDAIGRLVSVSGKGISDGSYGYDALNRLVSQTVSSSDSRQLYYQGDELVNEVQTQLNKITRLIKTGQTTLGVSNGSSLTLTAGDHHHSLLWSRDVGQIEGQQHCWAPYGSGKATDLLPGFNGERPDPLSGTYHLGNGYRAYSPVLMRFTCPDSLSPFGAGGINPYVYCVGDPVNHTDPSGHISGAGWAGIGMGILGLGLAIVTGGMSIAAAGGVLAALGAESTTTLVLGGLGVASDVTAIASGATEDSNPHISAILGWTSLATGIVGLTAGLGRASLRSVMKPSGIKNERFALGGTMKNLDSLGQDIYLFDDVYKGEKRLNLVAHGVLENDGAALIFRSSGNHMGADEMYSVLRNRIDLNDYRNIRTIMCHSGTGGMRSFGQRLARLTGLPVKSYLGTVTGNFEVNSLNQLLLSAVGKYGDDGMNYMRNMFSQKRYFIIQKTNHNSLFTLEHWRWAYNPVKYFP